MLTRALVLSALPRMPYTKQEIKEKFDGQWMEAHLPPDAPCMMACMFNSMTCCTHKMKMQFKVTEKDGKTIGTGTKATVCGCVRVSPCPCFFCCGYGPLAMEPQSVYTEEDGKFVGSGPVFACPYCPCATNTGALPFCHALPDRLDKPRA